MERIEKKKILVIGPGMEIGGVERSLLGLLDAIDYNGNDVDLFLYSHTGELMPYINSNVSLLPEEKLYSYVSWPIAKLFKTGHFHIGLVRLFAKTYGDIRAKIFHSDSINTALCRKMLTKNIAPIEKEYDVVYSFFQPHFFALDKVKGKEKIGWVHTDYSNENEKQDKRFFLPMWSGLDKIACVSASVKESFDSIYPELKDKTVVIENELPTELIRKQSEEYSVETEMPRDGSFRILSVGRFCTAKAFDEAIKAVKILREEGLNIKWYFIGYGPDEDKLKSLIYKQKSENYTIILGKKVNPYPYMKECDLYAQPSRYEGKAVTVCEAQLLGKPVLITDYNTAKSQLVESQTEHICPLGVNGIVEGIKYMMEILIDA